MTSRCHLAFNFFRDRVCFFCFLAWMIRLCSFSRKAGQVPLFASYVFKRKKTANCDGFLTTYRGSFFCFLIHGKEISILTVYGTCSCSAVESSKEMLGTFSPQAEPYTHEMPEEMTPSGLFARGSYSARTKVFLLHQKIFCSFSWPDNILVP